jgi:hypothetical protein
LENISWNICAADVGELIKFIKFSLLSASMWLPIATYVPASAISKLIYNLAQVKRENRIISL